MADPSPESPQDALVALMIAASASDARVSSPELWWIDRQIQGLPIFEDYDTARLPGMSAYVFALLEREDGLDELFRMARTRLPAPLFDTAYALAVDVVAADGSTTMTELRLLQEIRDELEIDRLTAAAIERAARARFVRSAG